MINFKKFKLTVLIIALFFTASCINNNSMKPTDFKNTEPSMTIEKYFEGPVKHQSQTVKSRLFQQR